MLFIILVSDRHVYQDWKTTCYMFSFNCIQWSDNWRNSCFQHVNLHAAYYSVNMITLERCGRESSEDSVRFMYCEFSVLSAVSIKLSSGIYRTVVSLKWANVSEMGAASIIRTIRTEYVPRSLAGKLVSCCSVGATSQLVALCLPYSSLSLLLDWPICLCDSDMYIIYIGMTKQCLIEQVIMWIV